MLQFPLIGFKQKFLLRHLHMMSLCQRFHDILELLFIRCAEENRHTKSCNLGMDPLQVTIFSCGTFEAYEKKTGKKIHQMNPSHYDMKELLDVQEYLNKVR